MRPSIWGRRPEYADLTNAFGTQTLNTSTRRFVALQQGGAALHQRGTAGTVPRRQDPVTVPAASRAWSDARP